MLKYIFRHIPQISYTRGPQKSLPLKKKKESCWKYVYHQQWERKGNSLKQTREYIFRCLRFLSKFAFTRDTTVSLAETLDEKQKQKSHEGKSMTWVFSSFCRRRRDDRTWENHEKPPNSHTRQRHKGKYKSFLFSFTPTFYYGCFFYCANCTSNVGRWLSRGARRKSTIEHEILYKLNFESTRNACEKKRICITIWLFLSSLLSSLR